MKYFVLISLLLATSFAEDEVPSQQPEQPTKLPAESEKNVAAIPVNALNDAPAEQSEEEAKQPDELKRPQRHLLVETYETPLVYTYQSQYLYQYPQPLVYYQPTAYLPQPYVLQKLAKK